MGRMPEPLRCHHADTTCSAVLACTACQAQLPECLANFLGDGRIQVCSTCLPASVALTNVTHPRPAHTCHVLAFTPSQLPAG